MMEPPSGAEIRRRQTALLDDSALVQRAIEHDGDAVDALVRRYTPLLLGYLRARSPQHFEDLFQETFAQAFAQLYTLRHRERFAAWLLKIAQRSTVNWARAHTRQAAVRERERVVAELHPPRDTLGHNQTSGASLIDEAQIIIDTILELPEPYNLILYLNLIHEQEPQAIAKDLGLRPGTLRMRLKRGLEKLRKALKDRGLSSP